MSIFLNHPSNLISTDSGDLLVQPVGNVLFGTSNIQFAGVHGVGIQFYGNAGYSIYMSGYAASGVTSPRLDATSDFNMYFRMTSGTNRGFVFLNNTTPTFQIEGNGNAQVVGTLFVGAGATSAGNLTMSGSASNRIDFPSVGLGAPTFTTRSAGTKLLLWPALGASAVDFALGIEGNNLWFSTPSSSTGFKWYVGTTNVVALTASGLTLYNEPLMLNYAADGAELITFNTDRPWSIRQRSSGSNTRLSFENSTGKLIAFTNGTAGNLNIYMSPGDTAPYFVIGPTTLTGTVSSGDLIADTPVGGLSPTLSTHFTTKGYIDDLSFKNSVRVATTAFVGTHLEGSSLNTSTSVLTGPSASTAIAGCTTTTGSASITVPGTGWTAPVHRLRIGSGVSGTGIPASTTVTAISGNTVTLSAAATASASGTVTLTFTTTIAALNIDGIVPSVGSRVLVKDHYTAAANGIYYINVAGSSTVAWQMTRATDADTWTGVVGVYFTVETGTVNAESLWISTNDQGGTLNTTNITFSAVGSKMLGLTVGAAFALTMKGTTSNWIDFAQVGTGAPTGTTRSPGTKIILRNVLSSTLVDYAIGIDSASVWYSVAGATSTYAHRWYAGTTEIMTLTGDATLTINSATADNIVFGNTSGTGNLIRWSTAGVAAPTFTTRSVGTKLVLYPNISSNNVDYAIGMASSTLWFSIPDATVSRKFEWYGGTTSAARLYGTGELELNYLDASGWLDSGGVIRTTGNEIQIFGSTPRLMLCDTDMSGDTTGNTAWLYYNTGSFYILNNATNGVITAATTPTSAGNAWVSPHPLQMIFADKTLYLYGNLLFDAGSTVPGGVLNAGRLVFDSGDGIVYDRTTNVGQILVGGASKFQFDANGCQGGMRLIRWHYITSTGRRTTAADGTVTTSATATSFTPTGDAAFYYIVAVGGGGGGGGGARGDATAARFGGGGGVGGMITREWIPAAITPGTTAWTLSIGAGGSGGAAATAAGNSGSTGTAGVGTNITIRSGWIIGANGGNAGTGGTTTAGTGGAATTTSTSQSQSGSGGNGSSGNGGGPGNGINAGNGGGGGGLAVTTQVSTTGAGSTRGNMARYGSNNGAAAAASAAGGAGNNGPALTAGQEWFLGSGGGGGGGNASAAAGKGGNGSGPGGAGGGGGAGPSGFAAGAGGDGADGGVFIYEFG